LIRASQNFGKEDLGTMNFIFLWQNFTQKINLKICITTFFQKFSDLLENLLNFKGKKKI